MNKFPIVIFCLMQIFYFSVSNQVSSRALFNETCSKEIRCDSRKFLTCSNGSCQCLMPDTMVYHNDTQMCVTLAGEKCQYTTEDSEKTWTDEVACIPNSLCQNGICECQPNFYEISNGTCLPKRSFGTECANNYMCDNSKHLYCVGNHTCVCRPTRVWMGGKCRIHAGSFCRQISDSICVTGASCVTSANVSKCQCHDNYFPTLNGTCEPKKSLGEPCSKNSECKAEVFAQVDQVYTHLPSFLVCVNGQCQCNDRISMKLENGTGRFCGKYLDHPCNDKECITGAVCQDVCKCKAATYYRTANDTCAPRKEFDETCANSTECLEKFPCNLNKGKCDCPTGKSFSPVTKTCVFSAGSSCNGNSYYSGDTKACVPGASCTPENYNRYTCKCTDTTATKSISGYDGYCYIQENSTCTGDTLGSLASKMCMPGLVCLNRKCVCPYKNHQVYNEDKLKCQSFIGGPCNATTDCLNENAECVMENGVSQCRCKTGYTEADRECDLAFGEKCDLANLNAKCDRYGPLQCSSKGICNCSALQIYDKNVSVCRGLVGSTCGTKWNSQILQMEDFCVDGAYCQPFRGFRKIFGMCACQPGWKSNEDRTCTLVKSPARRSTDDFNDEQEVKIE